MILPFKLALTFVLIAFVSLLVTRAHASPFPMITTNTEVISGLVLVASTLCAVICTGIGIWLL